jgi:GNAT superfamily N-acetyltransferase
MTITIRNYEDTDFDSVFSISAELGYTQPHSKVARQRLKSLQSSENDTVLVAVFDNQVIGWIHIYVALRVASAPSIEIGGLAVSKQFRRKGVGSLLVKHIVDIAKKRGLKSRVRCNTTRKETHHFYEQLGFQRIKSQYIYEIGL